MKTELKDLVIGRKYKIKSAEWLKENMSDYWGNKALEYAGKEMILNEVVNGNQLVLHANWKWDNNYVWLIKDAVEEVSGQPQPSKQILGALERLRKENYIYGYDGGPGGGDGGTIDTQQELILPEFKEDGSQCIYIKVSSCKRTFTPEKINELFEKGKTEQSFKATEWTTIRTELRLIEDKTKLPKRSSWSTMRD